MKKFVPFLLIGGGLVALYIFAKSSLSNNIKFVFRKIGFGGKILQPKVYITLGAQNPTNTGATIKSIVASVNFNGKTFADVSSFVTQRINPGSESNIVLIAEPSVVGIFGTIREMIKSGNIKGNFEITGTANIDGINLPLQITQTI
jgi:hypothetical protein